MLDRQSTEVLLVWLSLSLTSTAVALILLQKTGWIDLSLGAQACFAGAPMAAVQLTVAGTPSSLGVFAL